MNGPRGVRVIVEGTLGFLHGLTGGVEIVTGGDYGEKQDEDAPEGADEEERATRGAVRRGAALPEKESGQH